MPLIMSGCFWLQIAEREGSLIFCIYCYCSGGIERLKKTTEDALPPTLKGEHRVHRDFLSFIRFSFIIILCVLSLILCIPLGGWQGGCLLLMPWFERTHSRVEVTPAVRKYSEDMLRPGLKNIDNSHRLKLLLSLGRLLLDDRRGVAGSHLSPEEMMRLSGSAKGEYVPAGSEVLIDLPGDKRETARILYNTYMRPDETGIYFGPSAGDIFRFRCAFGCTHFARAFVAAAKSLGIIRDPRELRYVVACKGDEYNRCVADNDRKSPMNGHQFVMVRISNQWFAINTSRVDEYVVMPENFNPDDLGKANIPVVFKSYRDVTFLLRKIGKDSNDDCGDTSLQALMNIYRSGDEDSSEFRWRVF